MRISKAYSLVCCKSRISKRLVAYLWLIANKQTLICLFVAKSRTGVFANKQTLIRFFDAYRELAKRLFAYLLLIANKQTFICSFVAYCE